MTVAKFNPDQSSEIRHELESVAQLANGIAHEFNNILAIIIGNLSVLRLEFENGTSYQQNFIQESIKAAGRAKELLATLQSFGKLPNQKLQELDLYSVISEILFSMEEKLKSSVLQKVQFINYLEPEMWKILADEREIKELFSNILENALEAIEKKGPTSADLIRIHIEEVKNLPKSTNENLNSENGVDKNYYHIMIEDSGIGMTENELQHIFTPFYSKSAQGEHPKYGLGLPLAFDIITRRYFGKIIVESQLHKGTTFHIYFPIEKAREKSDDFCKSSDQKAKINRILLIDDEIPLLHLYRTALEKMGYVVVTAENGKKGLKELENSIFPIDMILLDMAMPEMTGREFLNQLPEKFHNIKIIISSGSQDLSKDLQNLPFRVQFLKKPYTIDELITLIEGILGKKG